MDSLHHVPVAIQERSSSIASSGSDSVVPQPSPFPKPPIKRKCTEKDDTDHPVSEDANCRKRAHCAENEYKCSDKVQVVPSISDTRIDNDGF